MRFDLNKSKPNRVNSIHLKVFLIITGLAIALLSINFFSSFKFAFELWNHNMPIKDNQLNGLWEISWFKLDSSNVNHPIEKFHLGRSEVSPPQSVIISLIGDQVNVSFRKDSESADCFLQGKIVGDDQLTFNYRCNNPFHEVATATLVVKFEQAYMPDEYVMEGQWSGLLKDKTQASGRIEMRSKFQR